MCCGQSEADLKARAEMGDTEVKTVAAAGKVLLYTTVPGMSITVPPFGNATNTTPVEVPAGLAAEVCAEGRLSPDPFSPDAPAAVATAPTASQDAPTDGPFHAEGGKVYHTRLDCQIANNVEPENRRPGKGDLKHCKDCQKLAREGKE